MTTIAIALMLVGSTLGLLAGLGLLRFPDLYTRLHAAAKAGPVGTGLIFISVGVIAADPMVMIRCALGVVFLILASPISAHLLARATLRASPLRPNTSSIKNISNSR